MPAPDKATSVGPTREQILSCFSGPVRPVKPSVFYKLGLALVCVMMVLLPVAYVALIGLVGWAVCYHAGHNADILGGRGSSTGKIVIYLTPIVVGGVLVLFMIKPLFARREKPPAPVSLSPAGEPLLFDFVRKLCETIGAPVPRRIDVDGQANASASFRRGFLSFFGNDLALTIGLPLVAGLNLRNVAGVLAHEFGHFAQGTGMRATYLIRAINLWFARVVYERDRWDANLEAWSKNTDWRLAIVLYVTRLFVWLSRRVLWVLMRLGHLVSMFMLRQMEYDADRYEIQVAGSECFTETAQTLPLLNLAHQVALQTLKESWNERRLGDDLPKLIRSEHLRIPPEVRKEFLDQQLKGKGSALDTHPPDQRRIEAARRANSPGLFTVGGPGTLLFRDFAGLSRKVTVEFYRRSLGNEFSEKNLIPTDELVSRESAQRSDQESLDRFFRGSLHASDLLFLPDEAATGPADPDGAARDLRAAAGGSADLAARAAPAAKTFKEAVDRLRTLDKLDMLTRANLRFKPSEFNLNGTSAADISSARRPVQYQRDDSLKRLRPAQDALLRRLTLALQLARYPEIASRLPAGSPTGEQLSRLLAAQFALRAAYPEIAPLADSYAAATILLQNIEGNQENEALVGQIRAAAIRWEKLLSRIWAALSGAAYPFDHAQGDVGLARFVIGRVPSSDDLGATIGTAGDTLDRFFTVYTRVLGQLVHLGEAVEAATGEQPPSPRDAEKNLSL